MAVRLSGLRRAAATAAGGIVLLSGCSDAATPPAAGPPAATSAAPTATAAPTPTAPATPAERQVALGEPVSLPSDNGTLTLTVERITVLDSCPGRGVPDPAPELGHFVVLDVAAEAERGSGLPLSLQPGDFQLTDDDGALQRVSTTEASWSCFEDAELAPPFVPAGQQVHGKIVLDASSPHGRVLYPLGGETVSWAY